MAATTAAAAEPTTGYVSSHSFYWSRNSRSGKVEGQIFSQEGHGRLGAGARHEKARPGWAPQQAAADLRFVRVAVFSYRSICVKEKEGRKTNKTYT